MDPINAYRRLHHVTAGQEQDRGRRFNAFLADLLQRGGLHDARSDQRGLHGRDEIDVHFTLGHTGYLLEAKWERDRVNMDPIYKLEGRLKNRPPGVRGVVVSMSGYTKDVYNDAESHADILLLDRPHIEAMVAGLFTAQRLFQDLLSVTSRRGGSYVPLDVLLPAPAAEGEPLPALSPADVRDDDFPALPEPGVTVTDVLTADGAWTASEVSGMAATASGRLLWTTHDGVLQVDPGTGAAAWMQAPALCHGPAVAEADGRTVVLAEEAALRLRKGGGVDVVGGGFTGSRRLLPGPDGATWVFASSGPRTVGGFGGHSLTQLHEALPDSITYDVDFPGQVYQAALTPAGTLYVAGGGYGVTTDLDKGWHCPSEHWADSAPLTPDASLTINDNTVLLAGRTLQGFEKALYAVDIREHTPTLLLRLPNTTKITGLAHGPDGTVYLLTDIRGNDQTPRPHLLHLVLPGQGQQ